MSDKEHKCDCGHSSRAPKYCAHCGETYCDKCYEKSHPTVEQGPDGQLIVAELHSAFLWDCDNCGTENVLRLAVRDYPCKEDIPSAHRPMVLDQFGVESWEEVPDSITSHSCSVPHLVTCRECDHSYATATPNHVI